MSCRASSVVFSPKILVARVEAILRRTSRAAESETLECGGIVIDKAAHVVTIDAKAIDLSYKEFELLTYFVENRGIALSREKILNSGRKGRTDKNRMGNGI